MERKASAVWKGGLKDGNGSVSSASGILSNTPYSFKTRFENNPGTNPEELIAAAHAACFSMALSAQLGGAESNAREHQHVGHPDHGETRFGLDHHCRESGCRRKSARRVSRSFQQGSAGCQGRLPCIEGPEREDYHEREAGIGLEVRLQRSDCRGENLSVSLLQSDF